MDEAVAVLLRMNLSTPELRKATVHARSLGNASNWSRSIFAACLTFYVAQAFNTALWRTEPGFQGIPPVAAAEALVVFFGSNSCPETDGLLQRELKSFCWFSFQDF